MTNPCTEQNPEAHAGADTDDGWDKWVDPEEGDGGDYDRALEAHDRQATDG